MEELFLVERKTTLKKQDIKVKIKMSDGTHLSEGVGTSHCADGNKSEKEVSEEIAFMRAKIEAIKAMNGQYLNIICAYQRQIIHLCHVRDTLDENINQLIDKRLTESLDKLT